MVSDSKAKVLITTQELEPIITNYNGKILYLDQIDELKNDQKYGKKLERHRNEFYSAEYVRRQSNVND